MEQKKMKQYKVAMERLVLIVGLFALFALLTLSVLFVGDQQYRFWSSRDSGFKVEEGSSADAIASASIPSDKFLGGLLSGGFDEHSCLSRYQSFMYRKQSSHLLSSYLVSKLRSYESLHRKCGPNTPLFNKSIEQLKSNHSTNQLECKYVIWSPRDGLGNKMLTIASTFLYALLTNRVMLLDDTDDLKDLFCEPFLNSSWILPSNFPIQGLNKYDIDSVQSYGNMVEKKLISEDPQVPATNLPAFAYLHLRYNYVERVFHKFFFCENDQFVLRKINWLLIRSDNYFLPPLFTIPQYKEELNQMFPLKETVFHHLGRYLFNPSNSVWEITTSYYNSTLAQAKQMVGIQIRIFYWATISVEDRFSQIINCTRDENILPDINPYQSADPSFKNETSIAVVIASLSKDYQEKMAHYFEKPTITGELVSVYQPSSEGYQQSGDAFHDRKALSEIILLSFSDMLVVSAESTFGYVSYSLSGIKPWFLLREIDGKVPEPPCIRAFSIEPCFHQPPDVDAKSKSHVDSGRTVHYIRRCQDFSMGVQLVD